ncbi:g6922 [Coccomyxa viridis]|uniref:G6922 protein n=1 Tax=Coccomyxa viridis TaxID=1274662 RepID=A0ABP1FYX0_9CHLO
MPPQGGFEHYAPAPYPPQPAPPTNTQQTAPAQDDASIDFSTLNIKQLQDHIRQHGGNPDDCNEKHELVKKASDMRDKAKEQKEPDHQRNYPNPGYGEAMPTNYQPPQNYGGYGGGPPPYGGQQGGWGGAPPQGGWGAPPPPANWGAPPPDYGGGYGPPPGQYGPPPGQWGGPPPQGQGYGAPPQNGYGAPPQNEYGRGEPQVSYGGAAAGRKKALICACNYKGSGNDLSGCINDAKCMQYMLTNRFGFKEENITVLLDDSSDPNLWPTGNNMRYHMRELVNGAQSGDSLLFHFSGHGSQTADWTGEEDDGMNETICPCDFQHAGQLVDNELNALLVNPLPHGVRLHAIIDACHSGSVMDLEFRCEFQGGQPVWTNEYSQQPRVWKGTNGGEAFQFGAARDAQTAADTSQLSGNVSTGAATFSFIQAVERVGTNISYGRLLDEMSRTLADMGHGGGAGSGQPLSDPFAGVGGLLGTLLGGSSMFQGPQQVQAQNQSPVLSANSCFDINRTLAI